MEEKSQIIEALKFFIYDPEGLAIVCHQNEVTNLCIESMNYILNNVKRTHADKPEAYFEEDQMENAARGELTPARTNFIQEVLIQICREDIVWVSETFKSSVLEVHHFFALKLSVDEPDIKLLFIVSPPHLHILGTCCF